jgi:hypothetical protein
MAPPISCKAGKDRAKGEEGGHRHVGRLNQLERRTSLARRHPGWDDEARAVRQRAEEDPFSREGGNPLAVYGECLAILRVPRIVDGDRT